ncbi:unnamed protein product, partial [Rotaria magnacalcarata]
NEATSTAADTSITNTIENTSNLNAYSTLLLSSSTLADRINLSSEISTPTTSYYSNSQTSEITTNYPTESSSQSFTSLKGNPLLTTLNNLDQTSTIVTTNTFIPVFTSTLGIDIQSSLETGTTTKIDTFTSTSNSFTFASSELMPSINPNTSITEQITTTIDVTTTSKD